MKYLKKIIIPCMLLSLNLSAVMDWKKLLKELYRECSPNQGELHARDWWSSHDEERTYGQRKEKIYKAQYKKVWKDGKLEKVKVGERESGSVTKQFVQAHGKREYRAAALDHWHRLHDKYGRKKQLQQEKIEAGHQDKFWGKIYALGGTVVGGVGLVLLGAAVNVHNKTAAKISTAVATVGGLGLLSGLGKYFIGSQQVDKGHRYEERLQARIARNQRIRELLDRFDHGKYHADLFDDNE